MALQWPNVLVYEEKGRVLIMQDLANNHVLIILAKNDLLAFLV